MLKNVSKKVRVSCPAYKNGKTFIGVITSIKSPLTYYVQLEGNSKSTSFFHGWVEII